MVVHDQEIHHHTPPMAENKHSVYRANDAICKKDFEVPGNDNKENRDTDVPQDVHISTPSPSQPREAGKAADNP